MDPEFDELKREFLAEAGAKIEEIRSMLISSRTSESRDRMIYLAHQLKGAGGSYGFQTISTEAASLEVILEKKSGEIADSNVAEIETIVCHLADEVALRTTELGASRSEA